MRILITGGAGYIGSITNNLLRQQGHETVVFDSMEYGHDWALKGTKLIKGDLKDFSAIDAAVKAVVPEAVIHFAAYIQAGESMQQPARYFQNNSGGSLNLLKALIDNQVPHLVFSSTAAVYGAPDSVPIKEDFSLKPENAYGQSKLMVEEALEWTSRLNREFKYVALRYFNACGADPEAGLGEAHEPETHIIPIFLDKVARGEPLTINGRDYNTQDGTCIRDYIHVLDLASAHIKALEHLEKNGQSDVFNVGTGKGYSNLEIAEALFTATDKKVEILYGPRRPGDPDILVADSAKLQRTLGWQPTHSKLDHIIADAWKWYQQRH
jgi:UDP-glucose-4-epimerase GalE